MLIGSPSLAQNIYAPIKGNSQQNVPDFQTSYAFLNFFLNANVNVSFGASVTFDANGNPTGALTGNLACFPSALPPSDALNTWVLKWTGTISGSSVGFFIGDATISSHTGTIVAGGTGGSTIVAGTNARFVLTWTPGAYGIGVNGHNMFFESGVTFTSFSGLTLCRLQDEALITAGQLWSPNFLALMRSENPGVLRFMGVMIEADSALISQWRYQPAMGSLGSAHGYLNYVPNIWCTFSNTGNAFSTSGYTDMPPSWTDAEVFMGNTAVPTYQSVSSVQTSTGPTSSAIQLNFAAPHGLSTNQVIYYSGYNTSSGSASAPLGGTCKITVLSTTAIELTTYYPTNTNTVFSTFGSSPGYISTATVNVGSRGAKLIVNYPGIEGAQNMGTYGSSGLGYFIYNAAMDVCLYASGPLFVGVSWAYCINLCNTLGMDFWGNLTCVLDATSAASMAAYAAANLSPNLKCYLEFSNETWNPGEPPYFFCWMMSVTLGMNVVANKSDVLSYTYNGLRTAMLAKIFQAAWASAGRPSTNLNVLLGVQEVASAEPHFNTYSCQGNLLSVTGNAFLSAYTGGISYNAFPGRPIDICDSISYAFYFPAVGPTTSGVYTWAQDYATGSQATALSDLDTALRASVDSNTGVGDLCPVYEAMAASYDGSGRPSGKSNLTVQAYEGWVALTAPTPTQYQSAGTSTSSTVTFNIGSSPGINWTAHGLQNGCQVSFSGGTLPSNLGSGTAYFVCNATTNTFDVSTTLYQPTAITLTGSPSGTTTALAGQYSVDNLYVAWLNSSLCIPTCLYSLTQYMSFSHSIFSSALAVQNPFAPSAPNPWLQFPGDINSTAFQCWYALQQWNAESH